MRMSLVLNVIGAGVAMAVLAGSAGAAKTKTFHFTETTTGAQISATEAVFKIHDSRVGDGAGIQIVKLNGLAGTDQDTTYYRGASAKSHGSFLIGTPDANGIAKLTGKGQDTGGTGKLNGFTSKYTYTGTFNTKTLVFQVVIKGVGSTT
ncbi:MAG: hypothetical protein M3Y09_05505 [Actinomycetota bacterium]|nr:hypothetical protein [Actinomycetota bacterium]